MVQSSYGARTTLPFVTSRPWTPPRLPSPAGFPPSRTSTSPWSTVPARNTSMLMASVVPVSPNLRTTILRRTHSVPPQPRNSIANACFYLIHEPNSANFRSTTRSSAPSAYGVRPTPNRTSLLSNLSPVQAKSTLACLTAYLLTLTTSSAMPSPTAVLPR